MPLGICENGHKFNRDRHGDTCPVCGVVTRKYKEEGKAREELEAMYKLPKNKYVCGWLVCIEGVNKGRSYGICSGKNFIGSGDDMDIQILGDGKVEKHRHAAVAFDEKTHIATLLPGESATLVYLDKESGDRISIYIGADAAFVRTITYEFAKYE